MICLLHFLVWNSELATRIDPKLSEDGRSVFEQRSEHARFLLSDSSPENYSARFDGGKVQADDLVSLAISESVSSHEEEIFGLNAMENDCAQDSADTEIDCDPQTCASFLALFPHRNESGVRYSDFAEWREVSRFHYLTDEEILATLHLDSKLRRAVRFDAAIRMQVLRVPRDSKYFNLSSADLLKQQFKALGITIKQYQYNNEWFFYIFFTENIDSATVCAQVTQLLTEAGFALSADDLIIMAADDLLPLPAQPGFCWINDRGATSVRRDEISLQGALALFLSDVTRHAVDFKDFMQQMAERRVEVGCDVGQTTISLLESIGLNINEQDRISYFSVFEANETGSLVDTKARRSGNACANASANASAPTGTTTHATTGATISATTGSTRGASSKSVLREAIPIRKKLSTLSAKLEPGSDVTDADYLRKLGQALRHP